MSCWAGYNSRKGAWLVTTRKSVAWGFVRAKRISAKHECWGRLIFARSTPKEKVIPCRLLPRLGIKTWPQPPSPDDAAKCVRSKEFYVFLAEKEYEYGEISEEHGLYVRDQWIQFNPVRIAEEGRHVEYMGFRVFETLAFVALFTSSVWLGVKKKGATYVVLRAPADVTPEELVEHLPEEMKQGREWLAEALLKLGWEEHALALEVA